MSPAPSNLADHHLVVNNPVTGLGIVSGHFGAGDPSSDWTDPGIVHLFLRASPGSPLDSDPTSWPTSRLARLEDDLRHFLAEPANSGAHLLWIAGIDRGPDRWRISMLKAGSDPDDPTSRVTTAAGHLAIRNYILRIGAGTSIILDDQIDPTGLVLHPPTTGTDGPVLAVDHGATPVATVDAPITINLVGDRAGCLRFSFALRLHEETTAADPAFGYPTLASLDAGFRLFFPHPDAPEPVDRHNLASHRYGLLDDRSTHRLARPYYPDRIGFEATIDPLRPLDPERSHLVFTATGTAGDHGLPSAFRTTMGHTVHLRPAAGGSNDGSAPPPARMVFTPRPLDAVGATAGQASGPESFGPDALYLAPSGAFEIRVPDYGHRPEIEIDAPPRTQDLVCGLSGLEHVRVLVGDPNKPAYIEFDPRRPAHCPRYPSIDAVMRELGPLLELFGDRALPDGDDLDLLVAAPATGADSGGLGIDLAEWSDLLDRVADYFPPRFAWEPGRDQAHVRYERVEQAVDWIRASRQQTPVAGAGGSTSRHPLDGAATTSWAYVWGGDGAVYHAQPDRAALFSADASSTRFLDHLEVPSVGLPPTLTAPEVEQLEQDTGLAARSFPLLPYGSVDAASTADLASLERAVVNPYRRNRIQRLAEATRHRAPLGGAAPGAPRVGTTPQGLMVSYGAGYRQIDEIRLAHYLDGGQAERLSLAGVPEGSALKAALQSNQLCLVASKPDDLFLEDDPELIIGGWTFELHPEHWSRRGTILIFKFIDRPLREVVADPSGWSFPDQFNDDPASIAARLVEHLDRAVALADSGDEKAARKYGSLARAATEANWTGILALRVHVPPDAFPPELLALAAGIDADQFVADHVGIEVTPVGSDGTDLTTEPSSMYGLIDYANPDVPLPGPEGYNFHVGSLSVVFRNSAVVDFAAEVMLVADRWFDEPAVLLDSPDGRNVIRLQGTAEEHNGRTTYSFGFDGANRFALSGGVIDEVEIHKVQFVTDPIPDPDADPLAVRGRFLLWSRIRFAYKPELDALSFGPVPGTDPTDPDRPDHLSAGNLQITMSFTIHRAEERVGPRTFGLEADRLSFDLGRSGARSQSLYTKFPLKLTGLRRVVGDPGALAASGYMPVKAPGTRSDLGDLWYGLTYELQLGTVGALAGSAGLVVSLLVGWVPGEDGVHIGLKLPGSSGGKREIPIQGIAKIAFGSLELAVVRPNPPGDLAGDELAAGYQLKLKNIQLKLFVLSVPPSGQTELILFGDPRENIARDERLLGWYGSYLKPAASTTGDGS